MHIRRIGLSVTTIVIAISVILSGIALAGQQTNTGFFSAGSPRSGVIEGKIFVSGGGSNDNSDGSVRVKLLKLKNGSFVKVAVKQATYVNFGWDVRFNGAPQSGTCKMVAIYSGTNNLEPSRGSSRGRCTAREW